MVLVPTLAELIEELQIITLEENDLDGRMEIHLSDTDEHLSYVSDICDNYMEE